MAVRLIVQLWFPQTESKEILQRGRVKQHNNKNPFDLEKQYWKVHMAKLYLKIHEGTCGQTVKNYINLL